MPGTSGNFYLFYFIFNFLSRITIFSCSELDCSSTLSPSVFPVYWLSAQGFLACTLFFSVKMQDLQFLSGLNPI